MLVMQITFLTVSMMCYLGLYNTDDIIVQQEYDTPIRIKNTRTS